MKLRAKLLISRGRLWHENVRIGEFGALSEDFRAAKRRNFDDFRVSDVPVHSASGSKVKTGDGQWVSGGYRSHQAAHLVGLVLFQATQGNCQHDCHAAGDTQMHAGFAAQEVVVEQKVATHACVDSLKGVSPVKGLVSFSGIARTWIEGAHGMLDIVVGDQRRHVSGKTAVVRRPGLHQRRHRIVR